MANLTNTRTWDPFTGLLADYGFTLPTYFERAQASPFTPKFEVKETKDSIVLKADLPGVKADDLDVSVHAGVLSISGKREQELKADEGEYHFTERAYGSFTRAFTVPEAVDANKLEAELKDGVLTLTLPKAPEAQPHKIQVKAAK